MNFGRIAGFTFIWEGADTTTFTNNYANEGMTIPVDVVPLTGSATKGGADISLSAAQLRSTYENIWSIGQDDSNAIWSIDEGIGYPFLKWQK